MLRVAFSSCGEWRLLLVVMHGLLVPWLLLLWSMGSGRLPGGANGEEPNLPMQKMLRDVGSFLGQEDPLT